jgi:hypothetical protein
MVVGPAELAERKEVLVAEGRFEPPCGLSGTRYSKNRKSARDRRSFGIVPPELSIPRISRPSRDDAHQLRCSSWCGLIDPAHHQLLDNNKSQDRTPNPDDREFPVNEKRKDAETSATENPKNQQASPVSGIPLRATVHAVSYSDSRVPCKSGETGISPSRADAVSSIRKESLIVPRRLAEYSFCRD